MGLDITAYRKLKEAGPCKGKDDEAGYDIGLIRLWLNSDFPGREGRFKELMWYEFEESHGFRAGSYSGYNEWRRQLARLVGTTPEKIWNEQQPTGPFVELVNFADNEGVLGTEICAKLAQDFTDWEERAKEFGRTYFNDAEEGHWFFHCYHLWHHAFLMAADDGAVHFH